ncbi:MAG: SAM-dependent methyltransferase [Oscillospiraceae bacterium]|nr:SAM-dependent methyltransferase [Oscillospiraceae bacterium]
MKLPISKRLLACVAQVPQGARVADIGADHGYLSIELLLRGQAVYSHASDLREQPIQKAIENARKFSVADKMRFSQADGLTAIRAGEVDTIVCAGMGGDLIARILKACPWVHDPQYNLILQPQSSGNDLRRQLGEMGFGIEKESLVEDGGFLYQVICVRYGMAMELTPGQEYISPVLLESKDPLLPAYFERILQSLETAVEGISKAATPSPRLAYYETALREVREMRDNYGYSSDCS